ncbi:MAG: ribulose-phosphate 3-epimerase [Candidatus Magasanikbacteria bacterium]
MKVFPSLNCQNYNCMRDGFETLENIKPDGAHIDVSDGHFNSVVTWNEPEKIFKELVPQTFFVEAHLMVSEPKRFLRRWLGAGIERAIIHVESDFVFEEMRQFCDQYNAELGMAISPETSPNQILPYIDKVDMIQCLSVKPGYSGQKFNNDIIGKIKFFRSQSSDVTIEVDGGVNKEVAKKVKKVGANLVVANSYIFNQKNPKEAFKKLKKV